jgi:hypothetical protein
VKLTESTGFIAGTLFFYWNHLAPVYPGLEHGARGTGQLTKGQKAEIFMILLVIDNLEC